MTTFAQRFEYARARQHMLGTWQDDVALAEAVGVAPSGITDYKARDEAPPAKRTLKLAKAMDVDPGWLAFGEDCSVVPPIGFFEWLSRRYPSSAAVKIAGYAVAPEPPPKNVPRGTKLSEEEVAADVEETATAKKRPTGKATGQTRGSRGRGPR